MSENKRKYYAWTQNDLEAALRALKAKTVGLNECSRIYQIPKPTLKRHLLCRNKISNDGKIHKGRPCVLSAYIEKELAQHLLYMESCMFGLTINDVRRLAYQIVEQNKIKHSFNKEKQMAGKSWFYKFMRRHRTLSVRQPESTSINRAKGFNKDNIYHFFDKLEKIVEEKKFNPNNIFNVDETGFSTVQKKSQKVIGQRGKKQVGAISSGERGVNTTAVCATSASGQYIPPMLIFKRKRMSPLLENGAPPGSIVTVSETGYINSELFVQWMKHFIDIVKPSQDKNVLLLLDGHTTHSRNLESIKLARENYIVLLQLPGHTTHRLQPLDVSIFGPMSKYYIQAVETWLRSNPGKAVSQYEVTELFNKAYMRAATVGNAVSGFKTTGIWPVNRNVFEDHDFLPSETLAVNNEDVTIFSPTTPHQAELNTSKPERLEVHNSPDDTDVETPSQSPSILAEPADVNPYIYMNDFDKKIHHNPATLLSIAINCLNPYVMGNAKQSSVDKQKPENASIKSVCQSGQPDAKYIDDKQSIETSDGNVVLNTNSYEAGNGSVADTNITSKEKLIIPISVLSPAPQNKSMSKRKRGIQKTIELTSSPYKSELEESIKKRAAKIPKMKISKNQTNEKQKKKETKQKPNTSKDLKATKQTTRNSSRKKTLEFDNSFQTETNKGASTSGTKNKIKPKSTITNKKASSKKKWTQRIRESSESSIEQISLCDDSDDDVKDDDDDYCVICNGYYYDKKGPNVEWIQCVRCHRWLHDTCSEIPDMCPECLK